jgi:hypothetical protein
MRQMKGHMPEQPWSAQPQAPSNASVASAPAQNSLPAALLGSLLPLLLPQCV